MANSVYYILVFSELVVFILFLNYRLKGNLANIAKRPIYLALIFNFFIGVIVPALQFNAVYYRYQEGYELSIILLGNLLAVISLTMLFIGYVATNRKTLTSTVQIPQKITLIVVTILLILPSMLAAYTYISEISIIGYDSYISDRISHGQSQGYLKSFVGNLYVSLLFLFAYYLASKLHKKKYYYVLILILIVLAAFLSYQTITGNRNSVFVLLIGLFVISYRFKTRVRIRKTIGLFFLSFFFILVFSEASKIRSETVRGESINQTMLTTLTKGLNGAFGNHENILWLLEHDFEPKYGATYVAAFLNVIPRSMWKSKPVGGGPALVNTIYPGKYVVGGDGNSSLTTGLNTEALLNFGYFGVFIVPFLLGILISQLKSYYLQSNHIISVTLSTILLLSFTVLVMYSEFLGLIARTGLTFAPLYLIHLSFKKLRVFKH